MAYNFLPDEPKPYEDKVLPLSWDTSIYTMPIGIVTREAWGALPPRDPGVPMYLPIRVIYFTYSETDQCSTKRECMDIVRQLQLRHMEAGHSDIHFNFLVGGDGNIYEGAGWDNVQDPGRPEYNEDDKCVIAFIRRGHDDEDVRAEKLVWIGYNFLDWAYPMKFFY